MIGKQLVEEVYAEAKALRKNATKEELESLEFEYLAPMDELHCVYGQMTGGCYSRRALELITKCAKHIVVSNPYIGSATNLGNYQCKLILGSIGDAKGRLRKVENETYAFSPIEVYITQKGADSKHLLEFLKGEVVTLDLSHTINC